MASDSIRKKAAEDVADAIISGEITYGNLQDKKKEVSTRFGCETPSNEEIFEIVEDADPDVLKAFLEGKKERIRRGPLKTKAKQDIGHEKNELLKHVILIAVVCLIVYANTFGNAFVFDDILHIVKGERLKNLRYLPDTFTIGIWEFSEGGGTDVNNYRPFFLLSLMADYQIWGLNPFGYHLMNLLFHILSTILLYLIVYQILEKREISLIAALLFAVHPIHTESVTFISSRTDVLFLFFFLLSFYFYIKSESKFKLAYAASVVSFFFAVFSKEIAITLPIIIVLYDFCFIEKANPRKNQSQKKPQVFSYSKKIRDFFQRFFQQYKSYALCTVKNMVSRTKFYLPFFTIAFLYLFILFFILGIGAPRVKYPGGSFYLALLTMSTIFVRYILLLFAPLELNLEHAIPIATSILEPAVLLSTLFLLALLVFTLKMYKSHRLIFFSIAWFFITLLPVSNILPQVYLMAERYLYLPSVGFCILAAVIIQKILDRFPQKRIRTVVIFCLILILAFYSVRTVARNADWKDESTLWSETIKSSPYSEKAHNSLGNAYYGKGLYDEAIAEFKEALRIKPNYAGAHNNLGIVYGSKGLYDEAIAEFKEALRIDPDHADAHNNLGNVYADKGLHDEAIAEFKEALRINPNYAGAHNNLGKAYADKGLHDEAIAEFKEALRIDPDHADAHYNLGNAYYRKGLYDEAIAEFKEALRVDPNRTDAHNNLGNAYANKGMYDEAIAELKEVLRINPNYADAHYNLGLVYLHTKQYDLAKQELEKVLEIDPNFEPARERLRELEEIGY